ncbi:MAG: mechanosensitive ion channel [Deltaproteobacteria bacterium]|nr:MAG: mechanosensitive ion channel [Deltaproteobacteria bacterium]
MSLLKSKIFLKIVVCWGLLWIPLSHAQDKTKSPPTTQQKVAVKKISSDEAIAKRLRGIFRATGWFKSFKVKVDDGVVFLSGQTQTQKHLKWASQLAQKTEDVVAVVNKIKVHKKKIADLSPAWTELKSLWTDFVHQAPTLGIAFVLLLCVLLLAKMTTQFTLYALKNQVKSQLLLTVLSRVLAIPVLIFGLYLVLRVSDLTRLAMTVIGGTSLFGLILGFAFRDIAENFLSSILLSVQRPFATGDLIEVSGYTGYVQSVNMRSTLLMTFDGNHVQIANAKIYKETITNFTANPKMRILIQVGIGYNDSISEAQSIALDVLQSHPAILDDPEPLVLAEKLDSATVNLGIYCWINVEKHSKVRVRSAILRLVKHAFQQSGIEMPDDAREVVFPEGVPVRMLSEKEGEEQKQQTQQKQSKSHKDQEKQVHKAEGNLESEEEEIKKQAEKARSPEASPDLLKNEEDKEPNPPSQSAEQEA